MSNSTAYQILESGPRNAIVKLTGYMDTSNIAYTNGNPTVPTLAQLAYQGSTPTSVRIDHIDYAISDPIEVQLFWDATVPTLILPIAGRGRMSYWNFGGLQNNAGSGVTGLIGLSTVNYSGTAPYTIMTYAIVLELVKNGMTT